MMKFGSVCSGIDAASVAWTKAHGGGMDWQCEFFSEIDKFPSAVLSHHYGSNMPGEEYSKNAIPNYGDMTKFKEWPDHGKQSDRPIDLLVGGTPCQSYSIAGLRKGLADPRGDLMLTYLAIARRYQPKWLAWENVPGVLSSGGGRDFGTFLGGLAELGYGFAYRVLDAQYVRVDGFGRAVPQRRRRVFVIGYFGDWRPAAAVLFEPESLRGNTAPSRKAGKGFAADVGRGTESGGEVNRQGATCLKANGSPRGDQKGMEGSLVIAPYDKQALGEYGDGQVASTCAARDYKDASDIVAIQDGVRVEKSQNGAGVSEEGSAYTLDTTGHQAVAFAQNTRDEVRLVGGDGGISGALAAQPGAKQQSYVAEPMTIMERGRKGGSNLEYRQDGTANALLTPNGGRGGMGVGAIATNYAVRRLTPIECARLQGFPDGFTKIPWRGKDAENCPDGAQYKAYGNSMAVNVMRWIGQRIEMVERLTKEIHGTSPE